MRLAPLLKAISLVLVTLCTGGSHLCMAAGPSRICDVRTFGAKGDGVTKDTVFIQRAIDSCAQQGGGIVHLGRGIYLSAPIVLKSFITFQLDSDATLLGSPDQADYSANTLTGEHSAQPFVSATGAEDIAIDGGGTIDGNGHFWWDEFNRRKAAHDIRPLHRPHLLVLDHCKHVLIENVTIRNGASWQVVPLNSQDITIRNTKIISPGNSPNTDGIDPFSCTHVVIDHVLIDTGDDNIAIKSGQPNSPGPDTPSTDISITDSTLLHGRGLSIGSEVAGGVQGVHVARVHFKGTFHGVRIKSNRDRGNDISDIDLRDLDMEDVATPLSITEYYPSPPKGDVAHPVTRLTPRFHDIRITNLTATGAKAAGEILGLPESPIVSLSLTKIHIAADKWLTIGNASVTADDVKIEAQDGKPYIELANSNLISR